MKKIRIGVIMGGLSIEREVSFNSGRTVCDHIDTLSYDVVPIFQTQNNTLYILPWHFLHRGKISDFEHRLASEATQLAWDDLKDTIDFMYIAQHGKYAEDGAMQGFLEVLGIPYFGTKVLGSALNMNKARQRELLHDNGIKIPNGFTVTPKTIYAYSKDETLLDTALAQHKLSVPLVIKPNKEGSSLGVTVVFEKKDILPALVHAATIDPHEEQIVVIEEKVEGMEFCCVILFDKNKQPLFLPPTEIVYESGTHFHDYEQKYMPGRATKYTPARTNKETLEKIQKTCLDVGKILEYTSMSRVDGFIKKDGSIVIIDPNALTGTAPSSFIFNQAAEINMSHTDLINHFIEVDLQVQGVKVKHHTTKEQQTQQLRVVVLLGGDTNEREISLESGRNICYKLSPHKYDVIPLFVDQKRELYPLTQRMLVHNSTQEIQNEIKPKDRIKWNDLPTIADFVFIGLHGGHGEDGSVQGLLEMLNLPYNGPGIEASALCMDKYKTNTFLEQKGFTVPKRKLITAESWTLEKEKMIDDITRTLPFPVIIKPHNDGCSVGVEKANTKKELKAAIEMVLKTIGAAVLVEEYVTGMELTVGVIGNEKPQALPPSQALSTGGILSIEEKFLPGAGENQTPAPLKKDALALVQKTVANAYKTLGCLGYSRIDCFYQTAEQSPTQKERVVLLEVNTLPGMTPATCIFHQAAEIGIKPMDFIDLIVSFGLQRKSNKGHLRSIKEQYETIRGSNTTDQSTLSSRGKTST